MEGAPLHFAAGSRFARTRRLVDPGPNRLGNEITARESAINLPPAAAAARIPEHARGAVISAGIRQQAVSGLGIAHREGISIRGRHVRTAEDLVINVGGGRSSSRNRNNA